MNILTEVKFTCRVSSVLNKEVKQYGKHFMFDTKADTSWSSDEGTPQWITVSLNDPLIISGFSFQFQGGFAGLKSEMIMYSDDGAQLHKEPFYPEDINSPQQFQVKDTAREKACSKIKFVFESSTDLFGRIIVYDLQLFN
ncbi:nuclear receptor 2C2-associated protein [Drosophila eugracilis]|uniref:nuclear receptor 2C2-associated protein n=1 Tax=Drosophila eugracilis TaxID=29029 RepID=UPI0007E6AFAA|nr:nuclear receptor 2C2-associated protein [Drosophila eugracilis]